MRKTRDGSVSTNSGTLGISTNKATVIKYAPYETRKNTYARWPSSNVLSPEPLCEAGTSLVKQCTLWCPLINIVEDFSIDQKPIFWLRLAFLAYISSDLVNKLGVKTGFQKIDIELEKLICLSRDTYIQKNSGKIIEGFKSIGSEGL